MVETCVDPIAVQKLTEQNFHSNTLPALQDYVRIPNLSPEYDPDWETNGHLEKAANHLKSWILLQNLENCQVEILKEKGFSPLLFVKVGRTDKGSGQILFYGHYDKQPHFTGWREGLSPTDPVIIEDKLYGRGSSDDGYCVFSCIQALKQCQTLSYPHPTCYITIEGCEESGSIHYHEYLESLQKQYFEGDPDLLVCLDSGAMDYDALWTTNSLRGGIEALLTVQVVEEGIHSGDASGIVPDSFRLIRGLLDRVESCKTGKVVDEFQVNVPPNRYREMEEITRGLKGEWWQRYKFKQGVLPTSMDAFQGYLNRTWKAQLSVTGASGLPEAVTSGNVLRPSTTLKLSMRTPPTLVTKEKCKVLKALLEENTEALGKVTCEITDEYQGWNAPDLSPFLQGSLEKASLTYFGKPLMSQGEGGSIPLIVELQEKYPKMQIIVSGLLGPESNAHGPNEMLHLPTCKKLICCITQLVADFSANYK